MTFLEVMVARCGDEFNAIGNVAVQEFEPTGAKIDAQENALDDPQVPDLLSLPDDRPDRLHEHRHGNAISEVELLAQNLEVRRVDPNRSSRGDLELGLGREPDFINHALADDLSAED